MSKRFFSDRDWPSATAVSAVVKGEPTFMALYRVLAMKHALVLHSGMRADRATMLRLYVESWDAYVQFFDVAKQGELELPTNAVFEILDDFVIQSSNFADLKASEGEDGAAAAPASEGAEDASVASAWPLPGVMTMLQGLVDASNLAEAMAALPPGANPAGFRTLAGYFAAAMLCRLHVKTGDYAAAIEVVRPLNLMAGEGLFVRIQRCHILLPYYAAFALVMARR